MSWKKMIDCTKVQVKMPLHQIQEDYESIYSKCKKNQDTVTEGLEDWRTVAEMVMELAESEAKATKQDIKNKYIKDPADIHMEKTLGLLPDEDTFVKPAEEEQINRTLRMHNLGQLKQETINPKGYVLPVKENEEGEKQAVSLISEEVETILSVFASSKEIFWFR